MAKARWQHNTQSEINQTPHPCVDVTGIPVGYLTMIKTDRGHLSYLISLVNTSQGGWCEIVDDDGLIILRHDRDGGTFSKENVRRLAAENLISKYSPVAKVLKKDR